MSSIVPVSVIIPCYRCSDTIERACSSVFKQTKLPEEIILVDDCSNDQSKTIDTLNKIKIKNEKINIKIIKLETNRGPGFARNCAWEASNQPYIAFLDADDGWHPKKLSIQYEWMSKHPEVSLTAHNTINLEGSYEIPNISSDIEFTKINFLSLLFSNYIPTRSVMLRRDINYRFLSGKRYAEDYLLWLSIVVDKNPAFYLNSPLAFSFTNEFLGSGLTADLNEMHLGLIDSFRQLLVNDKISYPLYLMMYLLVNIKYIRRYFIVWINDIIKPAN